MDNFIYDRSARPASSFITGLYYSDEAKAVAVQFQAGRFSGYSNVSPQNFMDFVNAESVGSHYNRRYSGSLSHPSFHVDSVEPKTEPGTWNDTPGKTVGDGKDFTVTLKIKATDIVDAATKVHGFTSESFTIVSLSEG